MSDNDEENGNLDGRLRKIENRLRRIHENQQISMCVLNILLIIIILLLWFSPTF